ncbi:MAG: hydrolase [Rickettsiales bacterium]|nr:hydrolase [Rickettsiales bacterium]
MNLNVACVQLSSCEDIDKNVKSLQRLVKKNLNKKIDLICLPECSPILTDSIKVIRENFTNGKLDYFLDIIKEMSISLQTYILIGSMPFKKAKNRYLNRSILFDRNGNQVCWYDKINLFDVVLSKNESYRESKNYDSGDTLQVFKLPWGKIGLSICYDLRFPELFRRLNAAGAIFFSIPAAFTMTTGKAHWESLLRARAIENGCFVFAPAQCGLNTENRRTFGNSMIIDPWGNIIARAKTKPTVIKAKINTEEIYKIRKTLPSVKNFDILSLKNYPVAQNK